MIPTTSAALAVAIGLAALPGSAVAKPWMVDAAKSTITFAGTATGQPFSGTFKSFAASIDFDPAKPTEGHATVTVETGSAATGDAQKDELIPGADFFNASAFPKAVFQTTGFKALGGDKFEADGTLTIRDVTKPIALPFTFTADGGTAHAVGTVQLLRQSFGVGQGAWSADDNVAFAVDVTIDIAAKQ